MKIYLFKRFVKKLDKIYQLSVSKGKMRVLFNLWVTFKRSSGTSQLTCCAETRKETGPSRRRAAQQKLAKTTWKIPAGGIQRARFKFKLISKVWTSILPNLNHYKSTNYIISFFLCKPQPKYMQFFMSIMIQILLLPK